MECMTAIEQQLFSTPQQLFCCGIADV